MTAFTCRICWLFWLYESKYLGELGFSLEASLLQKNHSFWSKPTRVGWFWIVALFDLGTRNCHTTCLSMIGKWIVALELFQDSSYSAKTLCSFLPFHSQFYLSNRIEHLPLHSCCYLILVKCIHFYSFDKWTFYLQSLADPELETVNTDMCRCSISWRRRDINQVSNHNSRLLQVLSCSHRFYTS